MKIGFVLGSEFPYVSGGIEGVTYNYLKFLSTEETEFIVVSRKSENQKEPLYKIPPSTKQIKYYIPLSKLLKKLKGGNIIINSIQIFYLIPVIFHILKREKLDVIVAMNPYFIGTSVAISTALYRFFNRIKRPAFVVSIHGYFLGEFKTKPLVGPILNLVFEIISRKVIDYSEFVTVNGEEIKKILISKKIDPEKIKVCPNGVDIKKFSGKKLLDKSILNKIVDELNLHNSKIVVYVGTLRRLKGLENIIEIAPKVIKNVPNTKFLFVGKGNPSRLISMTKKFGVEKHIIFTGERPDVDKILAVSDVFVLFSITEGLPLSILEAMASEVPVIATKVGEIGNVIEHGSSGYLIEKDDLDSLSKYTVKLLENEEIRTRMGENARKTAENFDWNVVSKIFLNVLKEAVEKCDSRD